MNTYKIASIFDLKKGFDKYSNTMTSVRPNILTFIVSPEGMLLGY